MALQTCPYLNPGSCEYVGLCSKGEIILYYLRYGITRLLKCGRKRQRRSNEDGSKVRKRSEDAMLLALKIEIWRKGPRLKEFGQPQSWKRQGNGPLEPPEYNTALLAP